MAISSAVSPSVRARTVGIKTTYQDLRRGATQLLPQRVALIGQGATASTFTTTKTRVYSAYEVGNLYGFGSPLHLAAKRLLPTNGDGIGDIPLTVYPLDDDGAGVAAAGTITPSGTATAAGTLIVKVNEIESTSVAVAVGDTVGTIVDGIVAAVNAVIDMPVIAADGTTVVNLTSKWKGASANDIVVEIVGTVAGISFVIAQPTGGATNPSVSGALAQIGDVWETLILNCLNFDDTTALTAIAEWNEGRWLPAVSQPALAFVGATETSLSTVTAVTDTRKTDRTNVVLVAPGSKHLPFEVAARQLARIAVVANQNPASDYGRQVATGIIPGTDGAQWTHTVRDSALKAGVSSVIVRDSELQIADTVTMYHPTGETDPAYRYAVSIVKLQNVLYNYALIFKTPEWDGAPLIPDDQAVTNPAAKSPKMAVAAIASMFDSLALAAIISDPSTAKASIQAGINDQNPNRLDTSATIQLSGNIFVISVDNNFGFYFGITPVIG